MMKPTPELDALLERAKEKGVFGTKMRSVIKTATTPACRPSSTSSSRSGRRSSPRALVPIIEPEVDIHSADEGGGRGTPRQDLPRSRQRSAAGKQVMLKLTLPEPSELLRAAASSHPKVLRVVALSGGYSRDEANRAWRATTA